MLASTLGSLTAECESWVSIHAPSVRTSESESDTHLSQDLEFAGIEVVAGSHETGEYSSLSRDRSR